MGVFAAGVYVLSMGLASLAFAEDGVHGGAEDGGEARAEALFLFGLGLFRILRHVVALSAQLCDGVLQLGDRGADVRELDDVRVGRLGEGAEAAEFVGDLLVG